NTVMQTANLLAEARTNPEARSYPAIASLVAKFHGPNHPAAPAAAAFYRSRTHLAFGGILGKQYDPFPAHAAARLPLYHLVGNDTGKVSKPDLSHPPVGVPPDRLADRQTLLRNFDRLRADVDASGTMAALDKYGRQAVEMVTSGRVRDALDLSKE